MTYGADHRRTASHRRRATRTESTMRACEEASDNIVQTWLPNRSSPCRRHRTNLAKDEHRTTLSSWYITTYTRPCTTPRASNNISIIYQYLTCTCWRNAKQLTNKCRLENTNTRVRRHSLLTYIISCCWCRSAAVNICHQLLMYVSSCWCTSAADAVHHQLLISKYHIRHTVSKPENRKRNDARAVLVYVHCPYEPLTNGWYISILLWKQ